MVLRQEHRAGEKLFTDYAGDTLSLTNPRTGEISPVYIFVATLGASNYTYAEGVTSLDLPSWIASHVRALEFLGGVPHIIVPDNTKCAVLRPDRYEPDLNPSFAEMAAHYGTAVIPARVRKPRDKERTSYCPPYCGLNETRDCVCLNFSDMRSGNSYRCPCLSLN